MHRLNQAIKINTVLTKLFWTCFSLLVKICEIMRIFTTGKIYEGIHFLRLPQGLRTFLDFSQAQKLIAYFFSRENVVHHGLQAASPRGE